MNHSRVGSETSDSTLPQQVTRSLWTTGGNIVHNKYTHTPMQHNVIALIYSSVYFFLSGKSSKVWKLGSSPRQEGGRALPPKKVGFKMSQ